MGFLMAKAIIYFDDYFIFIIWHLLLKKLAVRPLTEFLLFIL